MKFLKFILFSIFCYLSVAPCQAQEELATNYFNPLGAPVINPGKGWVSYGYPEGKSELELQYSTVGYERFDWATVEPSEGRYDWSSIEKFIGEWQRLGKKAAFGIMAANSHAGNGRFVTPKWVFDSGVGLAAKTLKNDGDVMRGLNGIYIEPSNFESPLFLEKLDKFVAKFAEKYDGDRRIAFLDIRSFENWGEGFSKNHLLIYKKYFKKTWLIQSSKNILDSEWIVSNNVGVRRDGIGGSLGAELVPADRRVPGVAEFWGNIAYLESRGWWNDGNLIKRLIEIGRPSYIEFIRGSPEFSKKYSNLVEKYNNIIGFNFRILSFSYTKRIGADGYFSLSAKFLNTGYQPIFYPCKLIVGFFDSDDRLVDKKILSSANPNSWMPREAVAINEKISLKSLRSGTYTVKLGLSDDSMDSRPIYALDVDAPEKERWYSVASAEKK